MPYYFDPLSRVSDSYELNSKSDAVEDAENEPSFAAIHFSSHRPYPFVERGASRVRFRPAQFDPNPAQNEVRSARTNSLQGDIDPVAE